MAEHTPQLAATANETADAHTTPPHGSPPAGDPAALLRPPQAAGELGRLGPFRVLRLLGTGGMGAVFAAEDPVLRRQIALKVMRPELTARPEARERFVREARAAAAVESDFIVPVHQVGDDNGVLFIAMPLLKGESLDDRLKRDGRLSVAAALEVAREVAEALRAAHAAGLVHRDIKPANLWLEGDATDGPLGFRRVRVLDFGLARPAGDAHLTGNAIVGTPAYMSPEQANGLPVDARTDLFSLGCVLYQCLAGRLPFRGPTTLAVLSALANATPPPVAELNPEVPLALGALVERLLAKDPAARVSSAGAVADAVEAMRSAVSAVTVELPAPARPRPRRRWGVALGAVVAGALAVAAGVVVVKVKGPDGKETEVRVPEGSKVDVDAKGNVTVQLPGAPPPPLSRLPLAPMPRPVDPDELECVLKAGDAIVDDFVVLPDSNTLVSCSRDGYVRVWDVRARRVLRSFKLDSYGHALALHPDGKTVAILTESGQLLTWDSSTGQVVRTYTGWFFGPSLRGHSIAFALGGELLLAPDDRNGVIRAFDTKTGASRVLSSLDDPYQYTLLRVNNVGNRVAVVHGHDSKVLSLTGSEARPFATGAWQSVPAFSPNGREIAYLGPAGLVFVATHPTETVRCLLASEPTYNIDWHRDGTLLAASGGHSSEIRVWSAQSGPKPVGVFKNTAKTTVAVRVRFSPDGKHLISCHHEGTICVFRVSPEWAKPKPAYPPLDPEWLARVQKLPPDEQLKEVSAELVRRNPGFDGKFANQFVGAAGVGWIQFDTNEVEDILPLRALNSLNALTATGRNKRGKLWDLSPLAGMQLTKLIIHSNPVWDLRPLQGMPLKECFLDSTNVFDLSPLAGMKLDHLSMTMAPVRDLSPLKGMPFGLSLHLHLFRDDINLSPLKGSVLRSITLPYSCRCDLTPLQETSVKYVKIENPAFRFSPEQRKALEGVKTLKTINDKPVAEYWKEVDALPPPKK